MHQNQEPYLDELVQTLATQSLQLQQVTLSFQYNTLSFQQETQKSIRNMELQISQLASDMSELETQEFEELPYQTKINSWENVSEVPLKTKNNLRNLHK